MDFLLKARHRFPSTGWWGDLGADGTLRCLARGPVSLPQLVMRLSGGIGERAVGGLLMGIEALCGLGAIAVCLGW